MDFLWTRFIARTKRMKDAICVLVIKVEKI